MTTHAYWIALFQHSPSIQRQVVLFRNIAFLTCRIVPGPPPRVFRPEGECRTGPPPAVLATESGLASELGS